MASQQVEQNQNPYILGIEGKRKKAGLAHELGAGAPCLKCGTKCPGFDLHFWRKICKNCRCGKADHDIQDDNDLPDKHVKRLFEQSPTTSSDKTEGDLSSQCSKLNLNDNAKHLELTDSDQSDYEWVPPGTPAQLAEKYMAQLPKEKQPIKGSKGAVHRRKQLEKQIPVHDIDASECHSLTPNEVEVLNQFVTTCKRDVVGQGTVQEQSPQSKWCCFRCKQPMKPGDIAIFAERAGKDKFWHPTCFVCCQCDEMLVDLIYFYKEGNIYCGRHFGDSLFPRCAACDELIFSRGYTHAEGQNWHVKHFCCWNCDVPLAGLRYVSPQNSKPHCLSCFDKLFGKLCHTCKKKIPPDAQRVSHRDLHWHAVPECFHCSMCRMPLLNKQFMTKQGYIFCSVDCCRRYMPGP